MREKHQWVASHTRPHQDQTHNPGLCSDRESNRRPFTWWADAQPAEPHWSELSQIPLKREHIRPLERTFTFRKSKNFWILIL